MAKFEKGKSGNPSGRPKTPHALSMKRELIRQQLVEHQEPWLSERHPIEKRSAFTIRWKNGGEVSAIPSGQDAIRAFHPTLYLQDESAFMPEGEEALNAVRPTGAKIICISTAAPGWFGDMCSL